jgi:hypothetical protein
VSWIAAPNAVVAWTLQREGDFARCLLGVVGDRVELHIAMTHDVVMSQRCNSPEQASAISGAWRNALVSRGWLTDEAIVTVKPKSDRRSSAF